MDPENRIGLLLLDLSGGRDSQISPPEISLAVRRPARPRCRFVIPGQRPTNIQDTSIMAWLATLFSGGGTGRAGQSLPSVPGNCPAMRRATLPEASSSVGSRTLAVALRIALDPTSFRRRRSALLARGHASPEARSTHEPDILACAAVSAPSRTDPPALRSPPTREIDLGPALCAASVTRNRALESLDWLGRRCDRVFAEHGHPP